MKRNKPPAQPTRIMPKRGKNLRNSGDGELGESSKTVQSSLDSPPRTRAKRKKTETTNITDPPVASTHTLTPDASANVGLPVGRDSPDAHCSICLGDIEDRSFTDACYHAFCFECLVEWSRVRAVCPLCKKAFKSIVHKIESHSKYETYYVTNNHTGSYTIDDDVGVGDHYGPAGGFFLPQQMRLPFIGSVGFWVSPENRESRSRHAARLMEFRRRIYTNPEQIQLRGLWSATGAVVPPHTVSPTMFNCYPVMLERVRPWVHRDLRIIVGDTNLTEVENLVLQLLRRFPIASEECYSALFPHLGLHTRRFLQELDTFARSPFDMATFDERVIYTMSSENDRRIDSSHPASSRIENISSSDDDSDVEIVSPNVADHSSVASTGASAPARPTPLPYGMAAAEYYHNLSAIVAGHQRATADIRAWDSPVPGPSSIRFWMPQDDNSNGSVSPSSFRSAPEGAGFASDPMSLSGSAASDNAATIVSDSESDVLVVDDEILACHSPIMLLSSSEDEVQPTSEQRKNRRSRKCNRPHRVAVNLDTSGAASEKVDDVTTKYDKPTADGHFYESTDASSDTAIRAEFLSVETARDVRHAKSNRRTISDAGDDSCDIPRSFSQRIISDGHSSNRSSPAVYHRHPGSRSSSVEIIDETSADVLPSKLPKWTPVEVAASSSSMSLGTGERRPVRPKRHRTKDPHTSTDKTTDMKSSSENDISRPPCKKHISGHKSSKRKLAGEVTMDLPVSPKCGMSDNVADEVQTGSSSIVDTADNLCCADVVADVGNLNSAGKPNSELLKVDNVVSIPVMNSPSVDTSDKGHSSQSSQVNAVIDGSTVSSVGLSSNDVLNTVADAEQNQDPCSDDCDADDKNQTVLAGTSTSVENVRESKLEAVELTPTDCEPSGTSADKLVDCTSKCPGTTDSVVVASCRATSDNTIDAGASTVVVKTDSDSIAAVLNNSQSPDVSEDQNSTVVLTSTSNFEATASLPSITSFTDQNISWNAVNTNPGGFLPDPKKDDELPQQIPVSNSPTTFDEPDNYDDDIGIPSFSLPSGRTSLSPTVCEPSSSADIVFSVLSDDDDNDDQMDTDVEHSSSDTVSELMSEDEIDSDNSEVEWLDSDLVASRRRHISISSASSGHSSVIVSPSGSLSLPSEPVDLTDSGNTKSVCEDDDDDDDDDFSVEMLSDDEEFFILDHDERKAETFTVMAEQNCSKLKQTESDGVETAADEKHLNYQSVGVAANPSDFDKITSDDKTVCSEEDSIHVPIIEVGETCMGSAALNSSDVQIMETHVHDVQTSTHPTLLLPEELVASCRASDSSTVSNGSVCGDRLERVDISNHSSFPRNLETQNGDCAMSKTQGHEDELEAANSGRLPATGPLNDPPSLCAPCDRSVVVYDLSSYPREPPFTAEGTSATDGAVASFTSICRDGTSDASCRLRGQEIGTVADESCTADAVELPEAETGQQDCATAVPEDFLASDASSSCELQSSSADVNALTTENENTRVDSFCSNSETSRLDISLD